MRQKKYAVEYVVVWFLRIKIQLIVCFSSYYSIKGTLNTQKVKIIFFEK